MKTRNLRIALQATSLLTPPVATSVFQNHRMQTMKTILIALTFAIVTVRASSADASSLERRIAIIEDKIAIKQVVDTFSELADTKEIDKQVQLFTKDGVVDSISNGKPGISLKGRKQLDEAFTAYLSNFHTVYHQNGQQTIDELTETTAKATAYCRVILVGKQDGKEMKTTMYVIYKDSFVKQNGQWLIQHRTSNFVRTEVEEVK